MKARYESFIRFNDSKKYFLDLNQAYGFDKIIYEK